MTPQQVDEAAIRVASLILAKTPAPEIISAVRQIVQTWRDVGDPEMFVQAGSMFRHYLQETADELAMQLPTVERLERDGFPVTITVNDTSPYKLRAPIHGAVAEVHGHIDAYLAIVATLDVEIAPRIGSLDSFLDTNPFIR